MADTESPKLTPAHHDTARPHLVTTRYAADYCGVSTTTIRRWIRTGDLRAFRVGPNGRRIHVDLESVRALVVPA